MLAISLAEGIVLILQVVAVLEKHSLMYKTQAPTNVSPIVCGLTGLLTCCNHKRESLGVSVKLFCDMQPNTYTYMHLYVYMYIYVNVCIYIQILFIIRFVVRLRGIPSLFIMVTAFKN